MRTLKATQLIFSAKNAMKSIQEQLITQVLYAQHAKMMKEIDFKRIPCTLEEIQQMVQSNPTSKIMEELDRPLIITTRLHHSMPKKDATLSPALYPKCPSLKGLLEVF